MATEDADTVKVPTDDGTLDSIAEPGKPHQKRNSLYKQKKSDLIIFVFDILSSTKCSHNPDNDSVKHIINLGL